MNKYEMLEQIQQGFYKEQGNADRGNSALIGFLFAIIEDDQAKTMLERYQIWKQSPNQ